MSNYNYTTQLYIVGTGLVTSNTGYNNLHWGPNGTSTGERVTYAYDYALGSNRLILRVHRQITQFGQNDNEMIYTDYYNVYTYNSTGTQLSSPTFSKDGFQGKMFYDGTTLFCVSDYVNGKFTTTVGNTVNTTTTNKKYIYDVGYKNGYVYGLRRVNESGIYIHYFFFGTLSQVLNNTCTEINLGEFPNFTITLAQITPFKRKKAVGAEKWYEKIKISYSGRFQNTLTAKEKEFFHKSLVKDWRNGFSHVVPISATFNVFKYINITPNITLNDRMYTSKIKQAWDPNSSAVVRDTTYGFYNLFDFNASVSMSTKIYGFYKPLKFMGDKLQMVRHVITPTVSFSASPDFGSKFWGYYGNYSYVDNQGKERNVKYPYFQHGIYGQPQSGKSGVISFNIANNLEAKVRSDEDSTGYKKISIIENLTLSQSYNFAADSLRWSNLNTSILLRITKGFNLNLSATWDVYKYGLNENGAPVRINKLRLFHGGGWGRLASTGTSFSYTFNNDTFKKLFRRGDKKKKDDDDKKLGNMKDSENKGGQAEGSDVVLRPDGYMQWSCPWSLTINYSINYGYGAFDYNKMEYKGKFTHNLSFNGNIRPTKNWNFSLSGSYNFDTHKIAYMNCSVSREMHCFVMSASFVPVGPYKSYNFHIAVKSSILSDFKYDKHSSYNNGVQWY